MELISFTPCTLASIASSLLVTSLSITRAEASFIVKETVSEGRLREGDSFTGSLGTRATPTSASAMNATMTVNDEICFFMTQE